jgi:putative hydrolase of the HAD superfamily
MSGRPQHLVIDADDTLWENNVFFETAFERFCELLDHSTLTPPEVRAALDEIELANIRIHGYGAANFARNLKKCLLKLAERPVTDAELAAAERFAHDILDHPIQLIAGVPETLEYLAARHELVLFTKGDPSEQQAKIERSGLDHFFDHAAIVREKDVAAYEQLAVGRGFTLELTWMVGNSPKSDINPSLAAGWNAAFVPHERTWGLEKTEIFNPGRGRLLLLDAFAELTAHF